MKVVDIEVYIVGYRKTDNDEWETSLPDFDNKEMVFGDWE